MGLCVMNDQKNSVEPVADLVSLGVIRSRRRRGLLVLAALLGLALLTIAAFAAPVLWSANTALGQVERDPALLPAQSTAVASPTPEPTATTEPTSTTEPDTLAPMNILIMGTDSRAPDDQGRSDALLLAHISGDRQAVYLISFPRDMWVDVPGHGMAKINAAYAWGGMPLAVQTVEQLTGAPIQHAALLDFEGFVAVIDSIGGVQVYNTIASASRGYDFPEGQLTLDGAAALAYTRERYDLPNGDLDRAGRQREVVLAITRKLASRELLTNPTQLADALNMVAPHLVLDEGLSNGVLIELALSMRISGGDGLRSLQAPIAGFATSDDGQAIDLVGEATMAELATALQHDTMADYWTAHRHDPPLGAP